MTTAEQGGEETRAAAAAARRASQIVLARQDSQGWWSAHSASDVTLEAEALLVGEVFGLRTPESTNATAQQIRSLQQADGRWMGNGESAAEDDGPTTAGDLSASVLAYLALRLAGDSPDAYHMAVAAGWIRDAGGLAEAGVLARTWLALFGLAAWSEVPVPAPELCFLPRRYAAGGLAAVAIAIIGTLRPVRELPFHVSELRAGDSREQAASGYRLRRQGPAPNVARAAALRACGQWLIGWQHRSGLPPARRPAWPCSLIALHLLGYPLDHPVLAKGLSWLDAAKSQPRQAPGLPRQAPVRQPAVLETTLAIEALANSGVAPDHDALAAAGRWLLLQRIEGPAGPGVAAGVEPSGWTFGRDGYPGQADTARVLLALSRIKLPGLTDKPATRNAIRWLTSMQGRDGSWSGSPTVTAHIVRALATHGGPDLHTIRHGVVWLLRQQQPSGSWPGRDGHGDLAVTAAVLHALIAAGVLPTKPSVRSAVAWLLNRQNADAGFAWVASSPGSQTQATACALAALLAAGGDETRDASDRAADWLVKAQQADGGWRDEMVHGGYGHIGRRHGDSGEADQGGAAGRPGARRSPRRRGALLPGLFLPLAALGRYVATRGVDVTAAGNKVQAAGVPIG